MKLYTGTYDRRDLDPPLRYEVRIQIAGPFDKVEPAMQREWANLPKPVRDALPDPGTIDRVEIAVARAELVAVKDEFNEAVRYEVKPGSRVPVSSVAYDGADGADVFKALRNAIDSVDLTVPR